MTRTSLKSSSRCLGWMIALLMTEVRVEIPGQVKEAQEGLVRRDRTMVRALHAQMIRVLVAKGPVEMIDVMIEDLMRLDLRGARKNEREDVMTEALEVTNGDQEAIKDLADVRPDINSLKIRAAEGLADKELIDHTMVSQHTNRPITKTTKSTHRRQNPLRRR